MRTYTARELRNAVLLAAIVTATVVVALLDPRCQRASAPPSYGPSRTILPGEKGL